MGLFNEPHINMVPLFKNTQFITNFTFNTTDCLTQC